MLSVRGCLAGQLELRLVQVEVFPGTLRRGFPGSVARMNAGMGWGFPGVLFIGVTLAGWLDLKQTLAGSF